MTKKEQARYRAVSRQLARMTANGWDRATHPDFEPLEAELQMLANKLICDNQLDKTAVTA